MAADDHWFVVMLPHAEYADLSDLFGPYRNETRANEARDAWNAANDTDTDCRAAVLAVFPASNLKDAR
jgi:hypothetical protein